MSKMIVDTWARNKIKQKFEYGNNDCRWIIAEFLQIQAQWELPEELKSLQNTYQTALGAARAERKMKQSVEAYILEAGYAEIEEKRTRRGDIVKIIDEEEIIFLPVIYSQVVLVGDPETHRITQANIKNLNKSYTVLRRGQ